MPLSRDEIITDSNGNIPVWGHMSTSGKPYYRFNLTDDLRFIMFPQKQINSKAPKFVIKLVDPEKVSFVTDEEKESTNE